MKTAVFILLGCILGLFLEKQIYKKTVDKRLVNLKICFYHPITKELVFVEDMKEKYNVK